jgi:glycosyltransferase involved in cell wall biosynthesis
LKISAIISTYNRARFLPGLFDSIKNQSLSFNKFEVIIINNNSTDETELRSKEFINNSSDINVYYHVETNQGLSYGRNRGIAESNSELVTFIDDDAVLATDFLEKSVLFFENHPGAGAAGGKILLQFTGKKPDWYNPFLAPLLGYFNSGDITKRFKRNFFKGSNMTFRKSLFDIYPPFDIRLGRIGDGLIGGEEKELFYRLKNSGVQLWYNAEAVVYHLVPEERTTYNFIKNQALGTGKGLKIQAKIEGNFSLLKAYLSEIFKWIASFIISIFYFIILQFRKGIIIIRFRYWVSKGLFV